MIDKIFAILFLCAPLIVELLNDSRGDFNKNIDVVIRLLNAITAAIIAHFIADKNILAAINLALAIHFLLFDYIIVMILNRTVYEVRVNWFTYLSTGSKVDNIKIWRSIGPYGRLLVKLGYFLLSVWLYLKF